MFKNIQTVLLIFFGISLNAQEAIPETYINPLDIDYTYMVYNSSKNISYRSGADPAVIEFRGEYFMFVTRSFGYWHSKDLVDWEFIKPQQWFFEGSNAPTAFNYKDSLVYFAGDPAGYGSILYTDDPKSGKWTPTASISNNIQDSELFIDDDGKAYLYWGSSNVYPVKVKMLDKDDRFLETGVQKELINLNEEEHGWERFGENNFHPTLKEGYMEGASMTKHDGKYYLQYAAPGTQFNVYADGVYIGDSPLGPFEYMKSNPMSFKPGGFTNGAGHGITVKQTNGQYWHFATMALASNSHWERRLCMFPTYFDEDGLMHANTSYGDYPLYAPNHPTKAGQHTGWMLLSYKGKATVSSSMKQVKKSTANDGDYDITEMPLEKNNSGEIISKVLTDESPKSFWVAEANDEAQWVQIEMLEPGNIYAFQLNFHDEESGIYTRTEGLKHRFTIEVSEDGQSWQTVVDRSKSFEDAPNAYIPLNKPVKAKYVRYNNVKVPGKNLALSEIRVFGKGLGKKPSKVRGFDIKREEDRRNASFEWEPVKEAQGYNIRWGIAPDKLYQSWLVYDKNELYMRNLDRDTRYYFSIEAFNENGISEKTEIKEVK
ncbi:family 43 glycosylhydrolase [Christiangramia flava]|uniref:Arabinan endo-1,5-alpha-L-arabinosidase A n=1 Tax=Christiangramia flava JLT2011 TaxID=1229726 RepID=A0A1L7I6Y5_9FLAO|nr:family 43 glycosylhydrolase [Christiangramia flava]APU68872.1 Arabinan endo-1,5-alpha-L-arabinosidase A [Christiangramia flava JLT2011]OSS38983.1 Arabinan endo-1,5-alpha-L-arabinosidase A [Christiangramia flava JLT2011]